MCIHYEIEIINCRCIFHVLCIFAGLSLWKTSYTLILGFSDKPTLLWCFYNSKSINLGWGPSYHSGSHHLHMKLGSLAWIWRISDISESGTTVFYVIRAASRLSFWMIFFKSYFNNRTVMDHKRILFIDNWGRKCVIITRSSRENSMVEMVFQAIKGFFKIIFPFSGFGTA